MRFYLSFFLVLVSLHLLAQRTMQSAWQQQANYSITVTLNEDSGYLFGYETIEYFNHSPDVLKEILIHLYPNAYKDNTTAYAREKIAQKDIKFWMAEEKDRGFITNLDFKSQNQNLQLKYSNTSPDNAKIILQKPLEPGKSIIITTPFTVKIPFTFSRLGHAGKSYQISQWFPKIAVYDVNGWNQIPYLDQGEFYSDYGNYDVSITLPKNYLVAATGNLQNQEEIDWLKTRASSHQKRTDEFDPSQLKTLRFTESNIHDFAFFADPNWCVASEEVLLSSGRKVTTYAFDTLYDDAVNGLEYIKKTLLYLSENVGEYPYNTAKSCTGLLEAGAGMEYPTVTIVSHQREPEVVHEIAHNWFYGILGSHERRYPWMDEGLTTFYEIQICTEKEPGGLNKIIQRITGNDFEYSNNNIIWLLGKINSSRADDAPLNLSASEYSTSNYASLIYFRTALNFLYLKKYLGDSIFNSCMKKYYEQWNQRHPLPGDVKVSFEIVSGKNLNWFFDGMINETQNYDFKILNVLKEDHSQELEIHLRNKSKSAIALPITLSNTSFSQTIWVEPFLNDTTIHIHNSNFSKVELNDSSYYVETNINNNFYFINRRLHKTAMPQLRIGVGLENKYHRTVFIAPLIGYNHFNKEMLGFAMYNSTVIRKKLEYVIAPLYSFEKKNVNGYLNLSYTFMPRGKTVNTWYVGVKFAQFNSSIWVDGSRYVDSPVYAYVPFQAYTLGTYRRWQPYLQFNFTKPNTNSPLERFARIDYSYITQNKENLTDTLLRNSKKYYLNVQYNLENKTLLNPYKLNLSLEKNFNDKPNSYVKIGFKAQYKLSYDNPKKKLAIDLFVGKIIYNQTNTNGFYNINLSAENPIFDYKYWNTIVNRDPGLQSTQILDEEGAVRSNILMFNTSKAGATVRFRSHLPFTNILRPYLDLGTYHGIVNDHGIKFFYTSGLSLVILDEVIEINFPLAFVHKYEVAGNIQTEVNKSFRFAQSKIINEALAANSFTYAQTVTVLLNLNKLNLAYWMRNFPLGN